MRCGLLTSGMLFNALENWRIPGNIFKAIIQSPFVDLLANKTFKTLYQLNLQYFKGDLVYGSKSCLFCVLVGGT